MSNAKSLSPNEISDLIEKTVATGQPCVISHLSKGKWHRNKVRIISDARKTLIIEFLAPPSAGEDICIDQPVGISFEMGFNKYLFESTIIGFEPDINEEHTGRVLIKRPITIEQMQRRAYTRVPVPENINVDTLFWHRGYTTNSTDVPLESYWQGKMVDLSAGGTLIRISKDQSPNFKQDQFIGMQFTPLPYEKPILIEAQIKHIAGESDTDEMISLGIEFLGLEASEDGREKLDKIVETIEIYQKAQKKVTV